MTQVPLFLQPANPPAPFVGRASDVTRIADACTRAPVVVLWGFSGIGKSALISATLAERFLPDRARTLVASAAGGDVARTILRALREIPGARVARLEVAGPAAEDAARAIVDELEHLGLWLVIEDVERIADCPGLARTLELALRFCRRGRVLCICREDPRSPALRGQTIAVAPMPADDLRALLEAVQGDLTEAELSGIVGRARGSPWRLLQLSMSGDVVDAGPEASLLALAPAAQSMLRTLSLVASSVPRELLGRAQRLPPADVLEVLTRRGYLEISPRGLRLHSAARAIVGAVTDRDERAVRTQKLVDALLASPAPREPGEALALLTLLREVAPAPTGALYVQACRLALDVGGDALADIAPADASDASGVAAYNDVVTARRAHVATAGAAWTVDARTMSIRLPDGTQVDLSHKKVLFDLLATLCARGGAATKEQLLEVAWGVRDYHPLRHDNRLKVAVRKLRRLLEDVLGADPIEALEDGYRLRGRVHFEPRP